MRSINQGAESSFPGTIFHSKWTHLGEDKYFDVDPVARMESFRALMEYFLTLKFSRLESFRAIKLSRLENDRTLKS